MKIFHSIIGVLVLLIFLLSCFMIYNMLDMFFFFSERHGSFFIDSISNEFYILLISTVVLSISSIPTIIYQTQRIFKKSTHKPKDDDLIDGEEIEIAPAEDQSKYLFGSTKFYAFALLTQIILFGKRYNDTYRNLASQRDWLILGGFMLAAFVAIYFLSLSSEKNKTDA